MRTLLAIAALLTAALPAAASAELPVGARAPGFHTRGAIGGKQVDVDLARALRRGPVVLYFFPKAFTQGCTLETRAFAEAHDQFAALGASVIGMSADDLPTLERFSTEECRSKFVVAQATGTIAQAYQVPLRAAQLPAGAAARLGAGMTSRTSYVIARDGRIRFVHSDLDYRDHVRLTLDAVRGLRSRR